MVHLCNLYLFLLNVKNSILISLLSSNSDSSTFFLVGGQVVYNLLNQISLINLKTFHVSRQCI